ncbi:MAG: F0F1 ATP synthase subunit delta [Actinobacteria bacterium]|nr:F0F1 ATP synthase subunit delta [Actinomycetota bacterium]
MRAASRASQAAVLRAWEPVVSRARGRGLELAGQLFALGDVLVRTPALRRALTSPSASEEAKSALAADVLKDADPRVVAVVQDLVGRRWSSENDLAEATELLGRTAILTAAESRGALDRVEDEIFRLTRALAGQREMRQALVDPSFDADKRADLAEAILGGKADVATTAFARRAASAPRGLRFVTTLGHLSDLIADRRDRKVATVTTAAPLSADQTARLSEVLARVLGREVELSVSVDPHVIGGLRAQSGADVIDATVLARLVAARRELAR